MREHLYKAKRKDDNEWTEGYLYKIWDKAYMLWGITNGVPQMIEVIPETVCEYVKDDLNGNKVFENDIVMVEYYGDVIGTIKGKGVIEWAEYSGAYVITTLLEGKKLSISNHPEIEVVGNLFDGIENE